MLPLKDHNPTQRTPVVTILLLLANIAVFVFIQLPQQSSSAGDVEFTYEYAAIPCELVTGEPLTVDEIERTFRGGDQSACERDDPPGSPEVFPDKSVWLSAFISMFLHGGWLHLGGNMLFLWIFGNNVEDKLGAVKYIVFYLLGGVVASVAHVLVDPNSTIPVVGASGAIAAVMGAYLVWFPEAPIVTLVFVFPTVIAAGWVLGFWFVMQFFTGPDTGVAWMAHVGGFVFGVIVGFLYRSRARQRQAAVGFATTPYGRGRDGHSNLPPPYPDDRRFGGRR